MNGTPLGKYESIGPQNELYIPEPMLKKENVLTMITEGGSRYVEKIKIETYYTARKRLLKLIL